MSRVVLKDVLEGRPLGRPEKPVPQRTRWDVAAEAVVKRELRKLANNERLVDEQPESFDPFRQA